MSGTFSSTSVVPRILLTPSLASWTPLFAGYATFLSLTASSSRASSKQYLGTSKGDGNGDDETSASLAAVRAHGNFAEHVPLALLLAGVCELNGGSKPVLNASLAVLFAARVAHASFGLLQPGHVETLRKRGVQYGRIGGFVATHAVSVGLGVYAFWLCFDGIKVMYGF